MATVGSGEIKIGPDLSGMAGKIRSGMARIRVSKEIPIKPDFTVANAQIRAWSNRPRQDIVIGVRADDRELRRFEQRFSRVEHVYKQSDLRRGIRINVQVAGAASLPALASGALSAATALTALGQSALLLPGILSGALAVVGTLATGLSGLGAAFQAAGTATKGAAGKSDEYTKSVRDMEKAQRDVSKAIKDARRDIEDQGDALRGTYLDQEQAQINLAKAREALLSPSENYTDYRQKLLDVRKAQAEVASTAKESGRTIADAYDTLSKGVGKADSVTDAISSLTSAIDTMNEAQKKAAGSSDVFEAAMAKLAPAAQDFVNKMLTLKDAALGFRNAVSQNLLAGLADSIIDLSNRRMPQLQASMQNMASSLNSIFKDVLGNIGSEANFGNIQKIFGNTSKMLENMRPGFDALVDGFLKLSEVGSRFLPRLGDAFTDMMERFERFVARADADGSLEGWINRGLHVIGRLGDAIMDIGSILNSVTDAYAEATGNIGGLADTVGDGLDKLASYLKSDRGKGALVDYLKQAHQFMDAIGDAMPGIIDGFQAFGQAARDYAAIFFPIFGAIGKILKDHTALATGLFGAYLAFRTLKPVWNGLHKAWEATNKQATKYKTNLANIAQYEEKALGHRQMAFVSGAEASHWKQQITDQTNAYRQSMGMQVLADDKAKASAQALKNVRVEQWLATEKAYNQAAKQADRVNNAITGNKASSYIKGQMTTLTGLANTYAETQTRAINTITQAEKARVTASTQAKTSDATVKSSREALNEANRNYTASLQTATNHTRLADAAAKQAGGPSGGLAKMRGMIGTGIGRAATGIIGAVGNLVASLGTSAAVGTAIYAMMKWSEINGRAADEVDRHREAVDNLAGSLSENTGAVTEATTSQVIKDLQHATNRATGENYGDVLAGQNVDPHQLAQAIASGDRGKVSELLAPQRQKVSDYFQGGPGKDILSRHPDVSPDLIVSALAGEPGAVDEFKKRASQTEFRQFLDEMHLVTGIDLEDLRDVQHKLPSDVRDPLELLQTANDKLNLLPQAQQQKQAEIYGSYGPATLNPKGRSVFGPGSDVSAGAGQTATVAIPTDYLNSHPELLKGLEENGAQRGADRGDGKVEFTLPRERAAQYVDFKARGGPVWGKGTATSDSIPAMLSNGEFVINAKSARVIGGPQLHALNNADRMAGGGFIPGFQGGGGWFGPKKPIPVPIISTSPAAIPSLLAPPALFPAGLSPTLAINNPGGIQPEFPTVAGTSPQYRTDIPGVGGGIGARLPGGVKNMLLGTPSQTGTPSSPIDKFVTAPGAGSSIMPALTNASRPRTIPQDRAIPSAHPTGLGTYAGKDLGFSSSGLFTGLTGLPYNVPKPATGPRPTAAAKPYTQDQLNVATAMAARGHGDQMRAAIASGSEGPGMTAAFREALDMGTSTAALPTEHVPGGTATAHVPGPPPSSGTGSPGLVPGTQVALNDPALANPALSGSPAASVTIPTLNQLAANPTAFIPSAPGSVSDALSQFANLSDAQGSYEWGGFSPTQMDCSGLAAAFANIATGQDPFAGGRFHTGNELEELTKRGFQPGAGGPGSITIGWDSGHTGVTLPDGRNIEAMDEANGIVLGEGSKGASGFPNVMHLPVDGTMAGPSLANIMGLPGLPTGPQQPGSPGGKTMAGPNGETIWWSGTGSDSKLMGPYGELPAQPMDIAKQVGQIAMQFVGGFFGLDLSGISNVINKITGDPMFDKDKTSLYEGNGDLEAYDSGQYPGNTYGDQEAAGVVKDLVAQAATAQAAGDTETAKSLLAEAANVQNQSASSSSLAANSAGGSGGAKAAVRRAFDAAGFPPSEWPALERLVQKESSWDPAAVNPDSHAFGLFQFLGHENDKYGALGGYSKDPVQQAIAGMTYIKDRYGTPSAALAFHNANNWYRRGGHVSGPGGSTADRIPAMLSDGEFVIRSKAAKAIGKPALDQMNRFALGGMAGFKKTQPPGPGLIGAGAAPPPSAMPPPQVGAPMVGPAAALQPPPPVPTPTGAPPPAAGTAPANQLAVPASGPLGPGMQSTAGQALSAAAANPGLQAPPTPTDQGIPGAEAPVEDSRGVLGGIGPMQGSSQHLHPAVKSGIEGAASTIGSIASMAASMGLNSVAPGAGSAAGAGIQAGAQMAGEVVSGIANIAAAGLVGTLTGGTTANGYGAPVIPQQAQGGTPVNNFIDNSQITAYNPYEAGRVKDLRENQRQQRYLSRSPV
jgi:hypothetical protein